MPKLSNILRGWGVRRCLGPAVMLFLAALCGTAARAQPGPCTFLTGPLRGACLMAEARQRSAANRARQDAARAAGNGAAGTNASSRAGTTVPVGVYAEPPTIDRSVKPAMLTFVTHPSYSDTPGKLRLPISHGCGGSSSDWDMTIEQACRAYILRDFEKANPLFRKSCEEGDPAGCFMYAGSLDGKDRATALAMYDRLCDIGHPNACYNIALAYEKGDGVPKNAVMQRTYYDRACAAGNNYGCAFIAGKVDADCPHGRRVWSADLDKKTYKVVCVGNAGPLSTAEFEVPPRAGEIDAIKAMAAGAHTSLPGWWVNAMESQPNSPGCNANDLRDANGQWISGSGCTGRTR